MTLNARRALAAFLWMGVMALSAPSAANSLRERGKSVAVAKSTMTVTPPRDWNRLTVAPGKKAETWTLDGEQLNDITFYGGVEPGQPLIREVSKKHKPLPKLKRETLIVEVPELLEGTYRASKGIADFAVISSAPDHFLGRDGIRFRYEFVDEDNLPRRGEARAVLVQGRLYMATLDAPRLHFFDRALTEFQALTDTATLP